MTPLNVGHWEVNAFVFLYIAFVLGALMRFILRAGDAKRSQVSSYHTRWAFVSENWDIFAVRTGFVMMIFSVWVSHPGSLATALIWFHVPADFANWIPIVPGIGSAWTFGIGGDAAIDAVQFKISQKWPNANRYLKGEVPSYRMLVRMVLDEETGS